MGEWNLAANYVGWLRSLWPTAQVVPSSAICSRHGQYIREGDLSELLGRDRSRDEGRSNICGRSSDDPSLYSGAGVVERDGNTTYRVLLVSSVSGEIAVPFMYGRVADL